MKKIFAALTVLALTSVSVSAFAACGSNTGRNTDTRAPATGRPTGGQPTTAGIPR